MLLQLRHYGEFIVTFEEISHLFLRSCSFNYCQVLHLVLNQFWIFRSSRSEVLCKNGALRNFTRFSGKHLCRSLLFKKSFWRSPSESSEVRRFCQLSVKNKFKQTVNEAWVVHRVHLYIWTAAGYKLTAIGTHIWSFNLINFEKF